MISLEAVGEVEAGRTERKRSKIQSFSPLYTVIQLATQ